MSDSLSEIYDDLLEGDEEPEPETLLDRLDEEWSIRRMVVTMVPLLVALSVLQMVSGSVLESFEDVLLETPSLLILVPVQIGTAGNLGSIMCSRLSTQLHLGTFELSIDNHDVQSNSLAVLGLGFTVFTLVGVAAWAIGQALGGTLTLVEVMTISLISGMLLSVFVVVVSLLAVYGSFKLGYNPDDTTIPVVTNVCDITGVLILFAVVAIVL
ncbi:magnesium transporter [Halorubraceae archaeon YAN]|nr:magnesium transporter [Halorubraceae archaeon YAN]